MFKKLFIFLIVLIVGVVLARNIIVKTVVQTVGSSVLGAEIKLDGVDIGLGTTHLGLTGLKIMNPEGFGDGAMIDIPDIYVDYALQDITGGKLHFEEVRLHVNEVHVVKNAKGDLNLTSLKAIPKEAAPKDGEKTAPPPAEPSAKKDLNLLIDLLKLKIGKAVFTDYSDGKGARPEVKEFTVNINEEFRDIDDPQELVQLIVFRALFKTPVSAMANLNLGFFESTLKGTLGTASGLATETVGTATGVIKGAAEGITDLLKNPFGDR